MSLLSPTTRTSLLSLPMVRSAPHVAVTVEEDGLRQDITFVPAYVLWSYLSTEPHGPDDVAPCWSGDIFIVWDAAEPADAFRLRLLAELGPRCHAVEPPVPRDGGRYRVGLHIRRAA